MAAALLGFHCPECGADPHRRCRRGCSGKRWNGKHCECERCLNAPFKPFNVCKPLVWEREILEKLSRMTKDEKDDWTREWNLRMIDYHNWGGGRK